MSATRSLHDVCEHARSVACGECRARRHAPCLLGDLGTRGYHVARFAQAWSLRHISGAWTWPWSSDAAVVFTSSTVVYDETARAA